MTNWHSDEGGVEPAAEQGKPFEGYDNDTSPDAARQPREGLSGPEGYDKRASQAGSALPSAGAGTADRPIVVMAFDPGITTGIATGVIRNGHMEVGSAQYKWEVDALWIMLTMEQPDHIVFERFDYRRHKHRDGLELFSRELIGVIKLYGAMYDLRDRLWPQTPAEAMGYYTDTELKRSNVYKTGMPHAMDAVRHLLQWYTFKAGYQFNTSGFSPA